MKSKHVPLVGNFNAAWWRAKRLLLDEGQPLAPQTFVTIGPTAKGKSFPFGTFAQLKSGRFIYWPPRRKETPDPTPETPLKNIDHISLDTWNGRSHLTWYNGNGTPKHESDGWYIDPVEDDGFSYWFTMFVKLDVIEGQDFAVEGNIWSPASDVERRKQQFAKDVQQTVLREVELPPPPHDGAFVCCNFFIINDSEKLDANKVRLYLRSLELWNDVDNPDRAKKTVDRFSGFTVGDKQVMVLSACLSGNLREDVVLRFAKKAG